MQNMIAVSMAGFTGIIALTTSVVLKQIDAPKREIQIVYERSVEPVPVVFLKGAPRHTPILDSEHFYLAATMWAEARGEGPSGMGYVGHVIMNRVSENFRGSTISDVVLYPKQFSCWNDNDPNKKMLTIEYLENTSGAQRAAWETSKFLAKQIMFGTKDYTKGALFYHADYVDPNWSSAYTVTAKIGNHIFYR